MSMPQFGSELARDRIERLIEEAQAHVPTRPSNRRSAGRLGRMTIRWRRLGSRRFRARHPAREIRLPR
jgi:hypothetical protein